MRQYNIVSTGVSAIGLELGKGAGSPSSWWAGASAKAELGVEDRHLRHSGGTTGAGGEAQGVERPSGEGLAERPGALEGQPAFRIVAERERGPPDVGVGLVPALGQRHLAGDGVPRRSDRRSPSAIGRPGRPAPLGPPCALGPRPRTVWAPRRTRSRGPATVGLAVPATSTTPGGRPARGTVGDRPGGGTRRTRSSPRGRRFRSPRERRRPPGPPWPRARGRTARRAWRRGSARSRGLSADAHCCRARKGSSAASTTAPAGVQRGHAGRFPSGQLGREDAADEGVQVEPAGAAPCDEEAVTLGHDQQVSGVGVAGHGLGEGAVDPRDGGRRGEDLDHLRRLVDDDLVQHVVAEDPLSDVPARLQPPARAERAARAASRRLVTEPSACSTVASTAGPGSDGARRRSSSTASAVENRSSAKRTSPS